MYNYPESYSNIDKKLKALKDVERKFFKEAYNKIKELIPSAEFPPTYFVVGGRRGIASGSIAGPLISIEKKDVQDRITTMGVLAH